MFRSVRSRRRTTATPAVGRGIWWLGAAALVVAGVFGCRARTETLLAHSAAATADERPLVALPRAAATPTGATVDEAVAVNGWGTAGELRYLHHVTGTAPDVTKLPLVVAIHGLGDTPEHFGGLFQALPIAAHVMLLQGPTPHGHGYAWFPFSPNADDETRAVAIRRAAGKVAVAIRALRAAYVGAPRAILTGFSQGGMLSYAVAVLYPDVIEAALPISGYPPPSLYQGVDGEKAPPIFAFHGSADPVLPFAKAVETETNLKSLGFHVLLARYDGVEHTVSPEMRRHVYARIVHALRSPLMDPTPSETAP